VKNFIVLILFVFLITLTPSIFGTNHQEQDVINTDKKIYDQNDRTILITGILHPSINGNASEDYGSIVGFTLKAPFDRDIDVLNFWSRVDRDGKFFKELPLLELGLDVNGGNAYPTHGIYTIEINIGNYRHLETSFQFGQTFLDITNDKKLYNLHEIIMITGSNALEFTSYNIEIVNPNGFLSSTRTVTSDLYGNFKTSFQIDNLVNLVNGNYTIQIPNITYEYSQVNFQIDNIIENQKTTKPVKLIQHEYGDFDKLIKELDMSNSKLKFYQDLKDENINLKIENELLQMQITDLQNTLKEQLKKFIDTIQELKLNSNSELD